MRVPCWDRFWFSHVHLFFRQACKRPDEPYVFITYLHTHIHTHTHTHTHTHAHTHAHTRAHTHPHTHTHTYVMHNIAAGVQAPLEAFSPFTHVFVHTCSCTYFFAGVQAPWRAVRPYHIFAHTHIHTHAHIPPVFVHTCSCTYFLAGVQAPWRAVRPCGSALQRGCRPNGRQNCTDRPQGRLKCSALPTCEAFDCTGVPFGLLIGLARTIYVRCEYGIFGREDTEYMIIYGPYIWIWPTLAAGDVPCALLNSVILNGRQDRQDCKRSQKTAQTGLEQGRLKCNALSTCVAFDCALHPVALWSALLSFLLYTLTGQAPEQRKNTTCMQSLGIRRPCIRE